MRNFFCQCGNRVFFDNTQCLVCGRELGFDSGQLDMVSLDPSASGQLLAADGVHYRRCSNHTRYRNCNWLLRREDAGDLCTSCRLNQVIPALDRPGNLALWTRVEEAKRRLLYSLISLNLPFAGHDDQKGLGFRIMEDRRRNPKVFESFVATAHLDGTITVNIAEADDATRHAVREQMRERYRTVLGHLRHESGHFYFRQLTSAPGVLDECREVFGDERKDYEQALKVHYQDGPPADWPERFVSAYASAHPAEDFAETFAHLLHIDDALETAWAAGLTPEAAPGWRGWIDAWIRLAVTLNEILRSLGSDDPYPFVITDPVKQKLEFINRLVRRPAAPSGRSGG